MFKVPLPDNGTPVKVGDTHCIYKEVYHPITWIGNDPYRPRVETLVIKDGNKVFLRLYDESNKKDSKYTIPGGSIDEDSTKIKQAENETNEEALISIKNISHSGLDYYEDYEPGFLEKGGDMPFEYRGSYSEIYVAEYDGPYDKSKVEEKDLDDDIAENGKFYYITSVAKILKPKHAEALLSSSLVSDQAKSNLRIMRSKLDNDQLYHSKIEDKINLFYISRTKLEDANLLVTPKRPVNTVFGKLRITDMEVRRVPLYKTIEDALFGLSDKIGDGNQLYVYTPVDNSELTNLEHPDVTKHPIGTMTHELWSMKPVKMRLIGSILAIKKRETNQIKIGPMSTPIPFDTFDYQWISKEEVNPVSESSNIIVPENRLYHGTTYEIDEFKPMSLDLGNRFQEPGWSTFCFAKRELALRFGLMRTIQKSIEYVQNTFNFNDTDDLKCGWDIEEKKPCIDKKCFQSIFMITLNKVLYVYTIDSSRLEIGIGNDTTLEEYTFRESGIKPIKTESIKIDNTIFRDNVKLCDNYEEWEIAQKSLLDKKNRGWYVTSLNHDIHNDSDIAKLFQYVKDGELKPGDDVVKFIETHHLSLKNISFFDRSSNEEMLDKVQEVSYSEETKNGKYPIFLVSYSYNSNFSKLVKTFMSSDWNHSSLALTPDLEPLYTFRIVNPPQEEGGLPRTGFGLEHLDDVINSYEKPKFKVNVVFVTKKFIRSLSKKLDYLVENSKTTSYDFFNLIRILFGIRMNESRINDKNMVCSEFVAKMLYNNNIKISDKPVNLINPEDIAMADEYTDKVKNVFYGEIKDYKPRKIKKMIDKMSSSEIERFMTESTIPSEEATLTAKQRNNLDEEDFGIPELRKYPLTDKEHVRSAIRFFNYVDKEHEKELAENIKRKLNEFDMEVNVGEENRFKKYLNESSDINLMMNIEESYIPENPLTTYYVTREGIQSVEDIDFSKFKPSLEDAVYNCSDNGYYQLFSLTPTSEGNEISIGLAMVEVTENTPMISSLSWNTSVVLEADDDEEEPTDYTDGVGDEEPEDNGTIEEVPEDEPTDYTDGAEDTPTDEPNNEDDTAETPDNGGDTTDTPDEEVPEDEPTDYTDGAGEEDNTDDTGVEGEDTNTDDTTTDTGEMNEDEISSGNNLVKNYQLLYDFEKIYNLTEEVSKSIESIILPLPVQNTVLSQILKNLETIKAFIRKFIQFHFDDEKYSYNLYYYNIVVQALTINLKMLEKNKDIGKTEKQNN